jgi:hypothetical protein
VEQLHIITETSTSHTADDDMGMDLATCMWVSHGLTGLSGDACEHEDSAVLRCLPRRV